MDIKVQPTLIERFPLVQSAHERLVVVRRTLNSPDVFAGWRTGLKMDQTHTHKSFCHCSKLTFLIVMLRSHWLTAGVNLLCLNYFNPPLVAHSSLPKVVRFQYLWRLASETQSPSCLFISPLSKQAPGLLYFAWISVSSHSRDNIQNQTVWIYFNAESGFRTCESDKQSSSVHLCIRAMV